MIRNIAKWVLVNSERFLILGETCWVVNWVRLKELEPKAEPISVSTDSPGKRENSKEELPLTKTTSCDACCNELSP
jgi:hypothetical protein